MLLVKADAPNQIPDEKKNKIQPSFIAYPTHTKLPCQKQANLDKSEPLSRLLDG